MNALASDLVPMLLMAIPAPKVVVVERDKRTMNNMSSEDKATHLILEQWGAETRQRLTGWPEITLLGRLMKQGAGASQAGRPPVSLSEEAARADTCVAKLCQIDQKTLVLYYHYLEPVEGIARRMSMRVRQAQNVLKRARWRFAAHLAVVAR